MGVRRDGSSSPRRRRRSPPRCPVTAGSHRPEPKRPGWRCARGPTAARGSRPGRASASTRPVGRSRVPSPPSGPSPSIPCRRRTCWARWSSRVGIRVMTPSGPRPRCGRWRGRSSRWPGRRSHRPTWRSVTGPGRGCWPPETATSRPGRTPPPRSPRRSRSVEVPAARGGNGCRSPIRRHSTRRRSPPASPAGRCSPSVGPRSTTASRTSCSTRRSRPTSSPGSCR